MGKITEAYKALTYGEALELVAHESARPKIAALQIMALAHGRANPLLHAAGAARYRECYGVPSYEDMAMHVVNALVGGYGVESGELPDDESFRYVNFGDTYDGTIVEYDGGFFVSSYDDFLEAKEHEYIAEMEPQCRALAEVLEVSPLTVSECCSDATYESDDARGGYAVLTDEEADERWDEYLENYIDDCILPDVPESARCYFDREAWKRDARHDGRAHCLSPYDGHEHEVEIDGVMYYVYRTN
jgi:hypothetical protein